jgi:CRP-like cAMP-binding protein
MMPQYPARLKANKDGSFTSRHTTKVDRIADALTALGKRLTINLNAA